MSLHSFNCMKPTTRLLALFAVCALFNVMSAKEQGAPTPPADVVEMPIRADRLTSIVVAERRLTTLKFPFKIREVLGVGFSQSDASADFLISGRSGDSSISISPTKRDAHRNLNIVADDGSIYAFDFSVGQAEGAAVVIHLIAAK